MNLLKMDGPHCVKYSAAMLLGIDPEGLDEFFSFMDRQVWWPDQPEPKCYRGINIQDIQNFLHATGRPLLACVDYCPGIYPDVPENAKPLYKDYDSRFKWYLRKYSGILIGQRDGKDHAVAWNHVEQICYDPSGFRADFERYDIESGWFTII